MDLVWTANIFPSISVLAKVVMVNISITVCGKIFEKNITIFRSYLSAVKNVFPFPSRAPRRVVPKITLM